MKTEIGNIKKNIYNIIRFALFFFFCRFFFVVVVPSWALHLSK